MHWPGWPFMCSTGGELAPALVAFLPLFSMRCTSFLPLRAVVQQAGWQHDPSSGLLKVNTGVLVGMNDLPVIRIPS